MYHDNSMSYVYHENENSGYYADMQEDNDDYLGSLFNPETVGMVLEEQASVTDSQSSDCKSSKVEIDIKNCFMVSEVNRGCHIKDNSGGKKG